jgi:hypothetical protein
MVLVRYWREASRKLREQRREDYENRARHLAGGSTSAE